MKNDLPYLNGASAGPTHLDAPITDSLPVLNGTTGYGGGQVSQSGGSVAPGQGTSADASGLSIR